MMYQYDNIFTLGDDMSIGINCKTCNIELTAENSRKRKFVKSGIRPQCKTCRNAYERKLYNAQDKRCETCGILCWAKGKRFFCSVICRFKAYYAVDTKTNCWIWLSKTYTDGYGKFITDSQQKRAHRISYELFKEPIINKELRCCHTCDNRLCVNPEHLWLGTNDENMMDMVQKGRQWSKLNPEDVLKIRKLAEEKIPYREIAEIYNLSKGYISNLVLRKKWKHV